MPRREAEWLKDRKATLEACFKGLDIDGSGFIDLNEMRRIATRLSPESNLQEALELIRWYDANNDGKVAEEEFMRVMDTVTGATSDADFLGVVRPILDEDFHDFHFGSGFKRPIDGEGYLQRTVLPTLREGLVKLLRVLGKEGLQTAAGVDWDEGKLPPGWRPFQALRWLGEWLREHDPERPKGPANWFCEMSRAEKLVLAFKHLDSNQNSSLELEEMLVLGGKLSDELDYDGARKYLQSMDTNQDGSVSQEEFVTYMEGLMDLMPEDQSEQGIQDLLNALHLSMRDRPTKALAVGNQVADRKTGLVPLSVLQRFVAALNPELDLQHVEAAPSRVGEGEVVLTVKKQAFVEVLQRASQTIEDERELDSILGRLLARPELNVLELQADLHPAKFSLLVRSLPQHGAVKQMDADGLVRQLQSAEAEPELAAEKVLLVDVRSPEEQEVSQIPGALSCPLLLGEEDDAAVWQSESRDLLLQRIDSWCAHSNVLVVKYCNTGERGNLSAKLLQEVLDGWPEALEKVRVVNLYGGIINWYNCGLPVLDPAGALQVEKVHPGQRRYMGFFLRPNEFVEPPQDVPAEAAEQQAAEREAQRMRDFKQRQSTPPVAAAAQA